jgi:hypothetical protein
VGEGLGDSEGVQDEASQHSVHGHFSIVKARAYDEDNDHPKC